MNPVLSSHKSSRPNISRFTTKKNVNPCFTFPYSLEPHIYLRVTHRSKGKGNDLVAGTTKKKKKEEVFFCFDKYSKASYQICFETTF